MSIIRRLSNLFSRTGMEREIDTELQTHIDFRIEDNLATGMSPEEARREALLRFGNPVLMRERVSGEDASLHLDGVWRDACYAFRQLRRSPGFAVTSILVLALGIGASTAIFSAVSPILLEPLPYPEGGRIAMIWDARDDGSTLSPTFGTYRELAQRSRCFRSIAVMKPWQPTMTGPSQPQRFDGQRVTASYFHVLGVAPILGRDFVESDDQLQGPAAVVLSNAAWRERFAADAGIVGRQITLDGDSHLVIGVMPATFENVLAPSAQIWTVLQYNPALPLDGREWGHHLRMVGRLQTGFSLEQARAELAMIAHHPVAEFHRAPWAALDRGFVLKSLQADVTAAVKPALLATFTAVLLLLVIACVNGVNLQLARGVQRRGEFAVRASLGAGRGRLIRQLVTESLLLASFSGALGIAMAIAGIRLLVALSPPGLPRVAAIGLDTNVYVFAFCIILLSGLAAGLVPALQVSREDLQAGLRQNSTRVTASRHWLRRSLVVTEVALSLLLLVGTGLLWRSMQGLLAVDPGFNGSHLLTMQVQASGHRFDDDHNTRRFFSQALEAVERVPGVRSAAFTSQLPLSGDYDMYGARIEEAKSDAGYPVFRYAITPDYLETIGIPLRRGRLLNARDAAGSPGAVLISESFVRHGFHGQDPIGKRIHIGDGSSLYTIVGIVADVKQMSLAANEADAFYVTTAQWPWVDGTLTLVVRARGEAAALAPAVRAAVWSVDKDQAVVRVATMDELLAASEAERRFVLILFEAFGLVALALAAAGIYGVLSGVVAERMREMGVRTAFGATRADILGLVLRQGMRLSAFGAAIGLGGSILASYALKSLLFNVSNLDPLTYLAVTGLLFGVAGIACLLPARRAAMLDPLEALRAD